MKTTKDFINKLSSLAQNDLAHNGKSGFSSIATQGETLVIQTRDEDGVSRTYEVTAKERTPAVPAADVRETVATVGAE